MARASRVARIRAAMVHVVWPVPKNGGVERRGVIATGRAEAHCPRTVQVGDAVRAAGRESPRVGWVLR
jgi:hypothetical protein